MLLILLQIGHHCIQHSTIINPKHLPNTEAMGQKALRTKNRAVPHRLRGQNMIHQKRLNIYEKVEIMIKSRHIKWRFCAMLAEVYIYLQGDLNMSMSLCKLCASGFCIHSTYHCSQSLCLMFRKVLL